MKNLKPSLWYIVKSQIGGKSFLYEYYCKGKSVLDIGCGEGAFLRIDPKNITGVEVNKRAVVDLIRKGFKVKEGTAEKLPFVDNSFDMAHPRNVIERLEIASAYDLTKEASRVIKPGGIFILASEVVSKKFWATFGRVKPYPPEAVIKLLRREGREEFEGIEGLEYAGLLYLGDYHLNKLIYLFGWLSLILPRFSEENTF